MSQTFYLSSTASDRADLGEFNQALATSTSGAGSLGPSVGAGNTDIGGGYTASGTPGTAPRCYAELRQNEPSGGSYAPVA